MRSVRNRILTAILIVCASVAAPRFTLGGPQLVDEIGWLPDDVNMVLAATDLARIRATPLGDGATALIQTGILIGGGNQSETLKAWRALSEKLGLPEAKTFDMLLGERLIYASRDSGDDRNDWIMISRTSINAARLVRKQLDVAPREIKHQRVLMTLEGGAYRLASEIDKHGAWLLLAPTSEDGLFDQITNTDDEGHDWEPLRNLKSHKEFSTLGGSDLVLYMTLGADPGDGWIGLTATAKGDSIAFDLITDVGEPIPAVVKHPTTLFDELREGALYAHIERLPFGDEKGDDNLGQPKPGSVLAEFRRLLELPRSLLGDDLELILGNRMAIGIYPNADKKGVACGIAMEASDVGAMATPGDAAMRSVVDSVGTLYGARETSFSFVGTLPRAVRCITLMPDDRGGVLPPFGSQLDITWSFRDSPDHAPAGWWIAGTNRQAFDQTATSLTGIFEDDDSVDAHAWLMMIESRPAEMLRAFESGGMPVGEWLRGLTAVESFQIKTWVDSDGAGDRIVGAGAVQLTKPVRLQRRPTRAPNRR